MMGTNNPMKNKNVSEKVREKLIGRWAGDKNPMRRIEVRNKIKSILKGHTVSIPSAGKNQ